MSDLNNIEKLFHEKLENFEMPVRAELWDKVAAGAGIGKNVFWSASKIVAAVFVGLVAVSAITWVVLSNDAELIETETPQLVQEELSKPVVEEPVANMEALDVPQRIVTESSQNSDAYQMQQTTPSLSPRLQVEDPTDNTEPGIQFTQNLREENPPAIVNETPAAAVVFEPAPTEVLNLEILRAPEKTEEKSLEQIHFPHQFVQVFSPNLPGESGQFSVYSENLSSFKIEIRTRAGKLVYSSIDPNFVWRGEQMDGAQAPEGTYMYTIFSTTMNGEPIKPRAGSVFLMRK